MAKDDYDKYEELLNLRYEIDNQIEDIKNNVDETTFKRMMKLKAHFDKKHANDSVNSQLKSANKVYKYLSFYERFSRAFQLDLDIDPGRLMSITDGIFGMVMTLLIFGLALPNFNIINASDFSYAIESLIPNIGITVISFILLATFWIYHHEFFKLKTINLPYLWVNIFFLIFISFIPFTTSLIGTYSNYLLSALLFGFNIFFTIIFLVVMYWYANKRGFMANELSSEEKRYTYTTFAIMMILTVIVIILDFYSSQNFIYLYLVVPIVSTIRDIEFKVKHKI
jgi:uncharacterized membrane protein